MWSIDKLIDTTINLQTVWRRHTANSKAWLQRADSVIIRAQNSGRFAKIICDSLINICIFI
jgi:hypothetical protein